MCNRENNEQTKEEENKQMNNHANVLLYFSKRQTKRVLRMISMNKRTTYVASSVVFSSN